MEEKPAPDIPTLYWRPGCPYCSSLRRRLRKLGVLTNEVNIWTDPAGAGRVREITGGTETVPTVVIGETGLVNPSVRAVVALLEGGPTPVPGGGRKSSWTTRNVAQWVAIGIVMAGSFTLDSFGYRSLSWGFDGVALVVYGAFRLTPRRA